MFTLICDSAAVVLGAVVLIAIALSTASIVVHALPLCEAPRTVTEIDVTEMCDVHDEALYEGPEAVICTACGEAVRDSGPDHACPNERRLLERRIYKGHAYYRTTRHPINEHRVVVGLKENRRKAERRT